MENKISLRGSLADEYIKKLAETGGVQISMDNYLSSLIMSNDPALLKLNENGITIIGKRSERGNYPPDW